MDRCPGATRHREAGGPTRTSPGFYWLERGSVSSVPQRPRDHLTWAEIPAPSVEGGTKVQSPPGTSFWHLGKVVGTNCPSQLSLKQMHSENEWRMTRPARGWECGLRPDLFAVGLPQHAPGHLRKDTKSCIHRRSPESARACLGRVDEDSGHSRILDTPKHRYEWNRAQG